MVLSLLLIPRAAPALDPQVPVNHYTFRMWKVDDGLPQSSVQVMVQGPRGYLWLGTQEGLARFDGVRFTTFHRGSLPAIPGNNVTALAVGRDEAIWVGMRAAGLVRMGADGTAERIGGPGAETATLLVRSLLEDSSGTFWVGTRDRGLFRLDPEHPGHMEPVDGLANTRVLDLLEDRDGRIWVATESRGIALLEGSSLRWLRAPGDIPSDVVWCLLEDHDGAVWAGTFGAGLVRIGPDGTRVLTVSDGLASDKVTSLLQDSDGNLWVGHGDRGLTRLRDGRVTGRSDRTLLEEATVLSLFEDHEGNLWVGTQRKGLVRLKDSLFTVWNGSRGLDTPMTRVVMEDREGTVWVGTSGGGLYRIGGPGGRASRAVRIPRLDGSDVFALHQSPDGALWVGTYTSGLVRFDGDRVTRWTMEDGLPANTVFSVEDDGAGGIWAGTYGGGLAHLRDGEVDTVISTDEGLPSNLVRDLHLAGDGTLWVATSSGGVVTLRDGVVVRPRPTRPLAQTTVLAIQDDEDGTLWFGTAGKGLCMLAGDLFGCVTTAEGLHDDMVYTVLDDLAGNLWMSCNHGIFGVEKIRTRAVVEGGLRHVLPLVFGRSDGMPTDECNGGSQPSGWRAEDGRLWFPTPEGVVALRLPELGTQRFTIAVMVETVRLDGTPMPASGRIVISPGSHLLEVDYTAITLTSPEKVRFQYRLHGLNSRWTDAGTRRTAYFDHLPPGRYQFQVRGGIAGRWGDPSMSLDLLVQPRLVERLSFWISAGLLAVLLVAAVAFSRIRSHQRRERELEERIAEATRELRTAKEQLEEANHRLSELARVDPLTGVPNRRGFDEASASLWAACRRTESWMSVLMIDIDCFKAYNDTYGHQAGDLALQRVAAILGERIRRETDLVGRYGGEEFGVLLPNTRPMAALGIAEEMRLAVRAAALAHESSSVAEVVTVSIGVASMIPAEDSTFSMLIRAADQALYEAKAAGRDRVVAAGIGQASGS